MRYIHPCNTTRCVFHISYVNAQKISIHHDKWEAHAAEQAEHRRPLAFAFAAKTLAPKQAEQRRGGSR